MRLFSRSSGAAFILGIALSGFFDGILLHQILQWHHLLSLVPGEAFQDIETQIYADGLFHMLMYGLAAIGLVQLWRGRQELARPGAGRRIAGSALLGFGAWNIVDVGVFHWILGIHRVRVNVENPLAYDLAWITILGVTILVTGLVVRRGRTEGAAHGGRAALGLVLALAVSAPVANLPVPGGNTLVVMRPGVSMAAIINATIGHEGRLLLVDPGGRYLVARFPDGPAYLPLMKAGGLLVSDSPVLAGCLAFTNIDTA